MIDAALHVWMNVGCILALAGFVVYCTLLTSTTWWGDD